MAGEQRCVHCNWIAPDESALNRHARRCDFKPVRRPRNSVVGRMATAAWEAELVNAYPKVQVQDARTGDTVYLRNVHSETSLGHQFTSNGDTMVDVQRRIAKEAVAPEHMRSRSKRLLRTEAGATSRGV